MMKPLFGFTVLGGATCLSGYFIYKYADFKKEKPSNQTQTPDPKQEQEKTESNKDNEQLKTTINPEKISQNSNIDNINIPPTQNTENPSEQITTEPNNSFSEVNDTNDSSNVVAPQSVVTSQPPTATISKKQNLFYKFTATGSSTDFSDFLIFSHDFVLEVCDEDDFCEEGISNLKIYDFSSNNFSTKTLFKPQTNFADNNVYLFETKTEIKNDWLNKKLQITYDSETVTFIKENTLERFTQTI